ncbi:hypothetical protein HOC13_02890 [Candidatus Woesearchaeota archaeon]|jgi:hypothetical protein|nr:hypothetical protein [Candidatus Woesearchaeota archaeon]
MKDIKGQGRTFWIVVTAVIALVVLVVLLLIFSGKVNILESGLLNCENKGGACVQCATEGCSQTVCNEGLTKSTVFSCPNVGAKEQICCLTAKKKAGQTCDSSGDCVAGLVCKSQVCTTN